MAESRYLEFVDETPPDRKTRIVKIVSIRSSDTLGHILWYGPWRQYAFFPERATIWNPECLRDVNARIEALMEERRVART